MVSALEQLLPSEMGKWSEEVRTKGIQNGKKTQHTGLWGGCLGPHADSFIVGCAGILKIDTFST